MYPIYQVSAKWTESKGANLTSHSIMMRERDDALAAKEVHDWWSKFKANREPEHGPLLSPTLTVEYEYDEAWCQGWFSHWTFDTGKSDQEVLSDFELFVRRMEAKIARESSRVSYVNDAGTTVYYTKSPYVLMGAEDRWRWTARPNGTSLIGCGEETGPPPCRCEHCKKLGIVRIDH